MQIFMLTLVLMHAPALPASEQPQPLSTNMNIV